MPLTPILADAKDIRDKIHTKAVATLHTIFPLDLKGRTLGLSDVRVLHQDFSPEEQKHALLTGGSLSTPVRGTLQLKDAQGQLINEAKNFTLVHLPYFTERHTVILDGNEYQVANMIRRKPGVYTERSENGELSSFFNLAKGRNFSLLMHPEKGTLYMNYGTTNIPLYPVLRSIGVPHEDIAKHWGSGVADVNRQKYGDKAPAAVTKLYDKLTLPGMPVPSTHEGRIAFIQQRFDTTVMHPEVNEHTLGAPHAKVTPIALLDASRRLLDTYNGRKAPDDGDSLAYKSFHAVDDFISERMKLTARSWLPKVRHALQSKNDIREGLRASPFTAGVRDFISRSPLTAVPTGINPIELIDHAMKITSLGEGGISSERAIPYEARMTHPTHYGTLDPIRTPESSSAGIDIRASIAAHRDDAGNLFTRVLNVRTKQLEFIKAGDVLKHVIAFPHQEIKGTVDAMVHGVTQKVPAHQVDYQFIHEAHALSPATTLIPMLRNIQGNRAIMGSKMQTQALPLVQREAPFLQVKSHLPDGRSYESLYGTMIVPTAPVAGTVHKIENGWIYIRPDGAKTSAAKLKSKTLGPLTAKIDRPKGYVKEWPGGRSWTYPVDYGYVPKVTGEDDEGLDVFLGDDEKGHFESFLKLKEDETSGKLLPDETKFLVGVTPTERKQILSFYGKEVSARTIYKDMDGVMEAVKRFPGGHKLRYQVEKTAADDSEFVKVPYQQHFPFPSKTYLHHDLSVKPGDRVTAGQTLGDSNFTRNGVLALGTNLRVGYMAYHGLNSNDAVVISEGAAKKLTSEHMYREVYPKAPLLELSKAKHKAYFGPKYGPLPYEQLDEDGIVRKGAHVNPKDILIAGITKVQILGADAILGKISKALTTPYRDAALLWEHGVPGTVVEVVRTPTQVTLLIKTLESMQVGDKLSGRYGNKGVVAKIIPDHEMVQDAQKRPLDVIMTSAGVASRINPTQIIETAVNKVVERTGKPIVYDNAQQHDAVQWAKDLLKEHGISDKEHLYDPVHKRTLTGTDGKGVLVGPQYIFKLFKSTDTNFSGHAVGPYDINEQPLKVGGEESAKSIGKMEFDALIAHNARNILHEAATIRGQKNDEFWRALQLGMPLPTPKPSFAFRKFTTMLEGAGVKVDKRDSKFKLLPLTDKDVLSRSAGPITVNATVIAKNLRPEPNGFFDVRLTGGPQGTLFSHIDLHEPIPSPVFEEPIRRLLGMTQVQFEQALRTHGGGWFKSELAKINVPQKLLALREQLKRSTGTALNDVVKQIKYLEALQANKLAPHEAYIINKVPVIPPIFRPITPHPTDPGQLMIADANRLYGQLMDANHVLRDTTLASDHPENRFRLYESVGQVYGTHDVTDEKMSKQKVKGFLQTIAGKGSPKGGFFQRKLMSRTQDVSGRGTAVPDPNLNMDQIGLPEQMLWQMFDKILVARLVRQGHNPLDAKRLVDTRAPIAKEALLAETRERPVFFNRAPTLHRYSVVGAYAVPVQGKTIRVNPFIEKGTNLDYDGNCVSGSSKLKLTLTNSAAKLLTERTPVSPMKFGPSTKVIAQAADATVIECAIQDLPYAAETRTLDKNGAATFQVPEGLSVWTYSHTQGRAVMAPVTALTIEENCPVSRVETQGGFEVIASTNESLCVYDHETEEVRRCTPAEALGKLAPVLRTLPVEGDAHDFETGWMIGAFVSDGFFMGDRDNYFGYTKVSELHRDRFASAVSRFEGKLVKRTTYREEHDETNGISGSSIKDHFYRADKCGALFQQCYLTALLPGRRALSKKLPDLSNFSIDACLGVLAGLIDGDGSLSVTHGKSKPQVLVNFSTSAPALVQSIQQLCLRLGIRCHATSYAPKAGRLQKAMAYIINFSTVDIQRYKDQLFSPTSLNTDNGHQALTLLEAPLNSRQDIVPVPLWIMQLCSSTRGPCSTYAGSLATAASKRKGAPYVSRYTAQRMLTDLENACIENTGAWAKLIHATDVHWDVITDVSPAGAIRVYDLEVPDTKVFAVNGGLVVWDTLQIHAPVTPGGVADAKRMTLSNLLFSDQTRDKLMVFPQHEAILGATLASNAMPSAHAIHTFKNREEALQAYRSGQIKLTDTVEVLSEKHAEPIEDDYALEPRDPAPDSEVLLLLSPPEHVIGTPSDEPRSPTDSTGQATGSSPIQPRPTRTN